MLFSSLLPTTKGIKERGKEMLKNVIYLMFHFFFPSMVKYCASLHIKMPNVANYPILITWCKIAAINWVPLTKWNETSVSYKRIKPESDMQITRVMAAWLWLNTKGNVSTD